MLGIGLYTVNITMMAVEVPEYIICIYPASKKKFINIVSEECQTSLQRYEQRLSKKIVLSS